MASISKVSFTGQAAGSGTWGSPYAAALGTQSANWLVVWAGEVITSYHTTLMYANFVRTKFIDHGKSAQFDVAGGVSARYHNPGTDIWEDDAAFNATGTPKLLSTLQVNKRTVNIDQPLVAPTAVDDFDEASSHWETRVVHTSEQGEAMANQLEQELMQLSILASRASATAPQAAGVQVSLGSATPTAAQLKTGIATLAEKFDDAKVPDDGSRYVVLKVADYWVLAQDTDIVNSDFGGRGSLAEGSVKQYMGVNILKSTNVPTTDLSSANTAGTANSYVGNFSTTHGFGFYSGAGGSRSPVGLVVLKGLSVEREHSVGRQATLMVTKIYKGAGILEPETAIELTD